MSNPAEVMRKLIEDPDELARRFAERVVLAKMDRYEAIAQTEREWVVVRDWVASDSRRPGSFRWCCDRFELEADAVRKAIREKVK